jgi:steroid 5-alpha reductase family enzyme
VAAVISIPILLAAFDPGPRLGVLAWAGAALWVAAASLERLADHQLARFKQDEANRGKVLSSGLWRYSRHPNYFFQWLTWVAYAIVALEAPYGWIGLVAPAIMLYLILAVTGVPPAEASSLRSRGDAYRRYQQRTSSFVPLPPRERSA